jgi:uncharacterized protein YggE
MPENEIYNHKCKGPFCWISHPRKSFKLLLVLILVSTVFVGVMFAIPYKQEMSPKYITVIGTSTGTTENKVATYSFTVTTRDPEKRTAVSQSRLKAETIVSKFKQIGIEQADIKTVSENTYQEMIYKDGKREGVGDWISSISTSVKLRKLEAEPVVSEILADSSIESSWGPDFAVNDKDVDEESLLSAALDDAKSKATSLAEKVGRKIVTVVNVTEGYSSGPIMYGKVAADGMGGGGGVAPGVTESTKTVTVTYLMR